MRRSELRDIKSGLQTAKIKFISRYYDIFLHYEFIQYLAIHFFSEMQGKIVRKSLLFLYFLFSDRNKLS